jgi:hypothetical protein
MSIDTAGQAKQEPIMRDYEIRSSSYLPIPFTMPQPPARTSAPALLHSVEVLQYRQMERAFRASGGIVSSDEVVSLLLQHTEQPISQLAHWIVDRDVLSFPWQGHTVLPLFQFDLRTMKPRPPVNAVVHELVPTLSDWEACLWFATPNAWLADATPLVVVARDALAVLDAARGERYLVRS